MLDGIQSCDRESAAEIRRVGGEGGGGHSAGRSIILLRKFDSLETKGKKVTGLSLMHPTTIQLQ